MSSVRERWCQSPKSLPLSLVVRLSLAYFPPPVRLQVVELMKNPLFQNVSMALLYHISMDDKCKSLFTYTGIIPWLLEYLLQARHTSCPLSPASCIRAACRGERCWRACSCTQRAPVLHSSNRPCRERVGMNPGLRPVCNQLICAMCGVVHDIERTASVSLVPPGKEVFGT